MARGSKWPNEHMWIKAVELRRSGLTYPAISGRLADEFQLEESPSEDTVGREIRKRINFVAPFGDTASRPSLHQDDLIRLLHWLHGAVHTPNLGFCAHPVDFGLASLLPAKDQVQECIVSLGFVSPSHGFLEADPYAGIYGQFQDHDPVEAVLLAGNPSRVIFHGQEEVIWQALQQHLEGDSAWDAFLEWQHALLSECRTRGELNAAIKAEAEVAFHALVTLASPPEARLTPPLISVSREELTKTPLGLSPSDLLERVNQEGGRLYDCTGAYLTTGLDSDLDLKMLFSKMIEELAGCREATAAAEAHEKLKAATMKAQRTIENHLVRHKAPGRCEWCPNGI